MFTLFSPLRVAAGAVISVLSAVIIRTAAVHGIAVLSPAVHGSALSAARLTASVNKAVKGNGSFVSARGNGIRFALFKVGATYNRAGVFFAWCKRSKHVAVFIGNFNFAVCRALNVKQYTALCGITAEILRHSA